MFIIIPKSNKSSYNNPKAFWPIVLLNIFGKLIKKAISNRFTSLFYCFKFFYPNQLGGIKQQLMTDTRTFFTHLMQTRWVKELHTSIFAFNITQFLLSLNYQLLLIMLIKVGFDIRISCFIQSTDKLNMYKTILLLLPLKQISEWNRDLFFLLFSLHYISLSFFIFLKKELKIKNQMQFFTIVILLFLSSFHNLVSWLNTTNLKFSTFQG